MAPTGAPFFIRLAAQTKSHLLQKLELKTGYGLPLGWL